MKNIFVTAVVALTSLPVVAAPALDSPSLTELLDGKTRADLRFDKRYSAVRQAAVAFGNCAGMNRRQDEIKVEINAHAKELDVIYNFAALAIRADTPGMPTCPDGTCKVTTTEGYIIPPVLSELNQVFNKKADDMIRVADAVYKIRSQAHFASMPPNWRTYLQTEFNYADCAAAPIAFKDENDQKVWRDGVTEGWQRGYKEGNKILEDNFERLNRDFVGMVRYHKLLRLGMVSRPIASGASLGVVGDATSMHVNEKIYRIVVMPEFNLDQKVWK